MKGYKIKRSGQVVVTLTVEEMTAVHKYYELECTKEYLYENYTDWSDDKVHEVAVSAREKMYKFDYTENEAIAEAIEEYEESEVKV